MKQLNCDFFQMMIEFDVKNFKRKEFGDEAGIKLRKKATFTANIGSRNKKFKEHAHITLGFNDEKGILKLEFIPQGLEGEDTQEPYLDNIGKWFAKFFKDEVIADMWVVFKYNRTYESLVPLEYPVLSKHELLKGAEIAGYEITFPPESHIHRASISSREKALLLFLDAKFKLNLDEFEFHQAIQGFSPFAESLVRKKETEK
jgi:hypothetical protein